MVTVRMHRFTPLVALALAALALLGCAKTRNIFLPDTPPEVRLTAAPYDTSRATPYFYAYRMNWIGFDPDGRIECYLYAVDPPSRGPIPWVRTTRNEQIVFFRSDSSSAATQLATRPHVFAICAVDDRGDTSAIIQRGFYSFTQCPTVTITNPKPSSLIILQVTPSVRVSWIGADPDGQLTSKPVKYRMRLLTGSSGYPIDKAILHPDSLRNYYAYDWALHGLPGPWAGWDSTSADTTFKQYAGLTPNQLYLFVVVAIDEAGAFSPVFSLDQNMVRFIPGYASTLGPRISMWNEYFNYTYPSGGWTIAGGVDIELPASQPITFNWAASPPAGASIDGYRWMLDGDPENDSTRTSANDFRKWSEWSLNVTSATVGPFAGGTVHEFWAEARDDNGLISLGHVHLRVVGPTFEKRLLVVSDVRMQSEKELGFTCPKTQPTGNWPNSAELDSFLFARGGVPWDCYSVNSEPGLFTGYEPDVYRTHVVNLDPTVPLGVLARYQNVVWLTDRNAPQQYPIGGAYALRYMAGPNHVNTLAIYQRLGGRVWLAGGGGAMATCVDYNQSGNDQLGVFTFSSRVPGELQSGRFMYDAAHWRSELQIYPVTQPQLKKSSRAVGGWTGQPAWGGSMLSAPDYGLLPRALDPKTPATDVLPPTRIGTPSLFYHAGNFSYALEFLHEANSITEDVDLDPARVREVSTLDTLIKSEAVLGYGFRAYEGPGVVGTPVMTYYHGLDVPQFVFTGFDVWDFQHGECQQLVDFVLQQILGLPKQGTGAARATRGAPAVWTPPAAASRTAGHGGAAAAAALRPPRRP